MPVPTYDEFIEPLLRYLAAHSDGAAIADVSEALANEMQLTPDDRAEVLPSRSLALHRNRIGWTHDRLFALNSERAEKKRLLGITSNGGAGGPKGKSKKGVAKKRAAAADGQGDLPGVE